MTTIEDYIGALPQGWNSFPECRIKADLLDLAKQRINASGAEIPVQLAPIFAPNPPKWYPEVLACATTMFYRDTCFPDEAAFLADAYAYNLEALSTPVNRVIFAVVSPSIVLSGAAKRWSSFHLGSKLWLRRTERVDGRQSADLELSYPAHLFPLTLLGAFAQSFRSAASLAGAKDTTADIIEQQSTRALFRASWT